MIMISIFTKRNVVPTSGVRMTAAKTPPTDNAIISTAKFDSRTKTMATKLDPPATRPL